MKRENGPEAIYIQSVSTPVIDSGLILLTDYLSTIIDYLSMITYPVKNVLCVYCFKT